MSIVRHSNQDTIIITGEQHFTIDDIKNIQKSVADLIQKHPQIRYVIYKLPISELSFVDVVATLERISSDSPGSLTDSRIKSIWVGFNAYSSLVRQHFNVNNLGVPVLGTLDEALIAIEGFKRSQIPCN